MNINDFNEPQNTLGQEHNISRLYKSPAYNTSEAQQLKEFETESEKKNPLLGLEIIQKGLQVFGTNMIEQIKKQVKILRMNISESVNLNDEIQGGKQIFEDRIMKLLQKEKQIFEEINSLDRTKKKRKT